MGDYMGKVEVDEHGRLTLPLKIREKLLIQPGDKLTIKINSDNSIHIKKSPSKKEIFDKLVGYYNIGATYILICKCIFKTNSLICKLIKIGSNF